MKNFLKADIKENCRRDYDNMRDAMIYGEKPTWEQLIDAMERLQKRVKSLLARYRNKKFAS